MRRVEIIEGSAQVIKALQEADVLKIFNISHELRRERNPASDTAILQTLKEYEGFASRYNQAASEIERILELTPLRDPRFWTMVLNPDVNDIPRELYEARSNVLFALNYLPMFVSLLERNAPGQVRLDQPLETDNRILTLLLFEAESTFSTTERVVEAIEAIQLLYEVGAGVLKQDGVALSLVSCDSGSDKSFDFLGAAKVVEQTKELILEIWERISLIKETRVKEQFEVIEKSLPIYEKIRNLEQTQAITPEQAEILRQKLSNGTSKFLNSGSAIPEIEVNAQKNPRLLLAPSPKLLTEGSPSINKTAKQVRNTRPKRKAG